MRNLWQNEFRENVSMKNVQLPSTLIMHSVIQRHWVRACYCINTFYLLFSREKKTLRDERRRKKNILYDDCLFWFRLWFDCWIIPFTPLFSLRNHVKKCTSQRCILLESMSNTRRCRRRHHRWFGILPCSRYIQRTKWMYKSFRTNKKKIK